MKYRVYLACQHWNPERIPLPRTHCGIQTWPPWTTPQKHVHSHPITVKAGRFQSLYTVYTNFLNDSLRSNSVPDLPSLCLRVCSPGFLISLCFLVFIFELPDFLPVPVYKFAEHFRFVYQF